MREREREREKARERKRKRETGERERERERERETEYYLAFGRRIADDEAKISKKIYLTIFPCVDPPASGSLSFSRESPAGDKYVVLRRLCL